MTSAAPVQDRFALTEARLAGEPGAYELPVRTSPGRHGGNDGRSGE